MSYLVIDTEGNPLKQVAVIDAKGHLIYEAYTELANDKHANKKKFHEISHDLKSLLNGHICVFHNAGADLQTLRASLDLDSELKYECTEQLARRLFPSLPSYGLAELCTYFKINHQGRGFTLSNAHDAQYDARFTYELYRYLCRYKLKQEKYPNVFSSVRVDTPFQDFPDAFKVQEPQYRYIYQLVQEIREDNNLQSQGVVILGEAGSGKTHMAMRIAQQLLKYNRLFFILQPAHENNVLYHIYSSVLQSLVQPVEKGYTQLEYFLSNIFFSILSKYQNNEDDRWLLEKLSKDRLYLFCESGNNETKIREERIERLEKYLLRWHNSQRFNNLFSEIFIKGLIKYCRYRREYYRDIIIRWLAGSGIEEDEETKIGLPDWGETLTSNDFALQALISLSVLSTLDQPLLIIFDQLEGLANPNNRPILLKLGEALRELMTNLRNTLFILNLFPITWQYFQDTLEKSTIERLSANTICIQEPAADEILAVLNERLKPAGVFAEAFFNLEELHQIVHSESIRSSLILAANLYRKIVNEINFSDLSIGHYPNAISEVTQEVQNLIIKINDLEQRIKILEERTISKISIEEELYKFLREKKYILAKDYGKIGYQNNYHELGVLKCVLNYLQIVKPNISLTQYAIQMPINDQIIYLGHCKKYVIIMNNPETSRKPTINVNACFRAIQSFLADKTEATLFIYRDNRIRFPQSNNSPAARNWRSLQHRFGHRLEIRHINVNDYIWLHLFYTMITAIENKEFEGDVRPAEAVNLFLKKYPNEFWSYLFR